MATERRATSSPWRLEQTPPAGTSDQGEPVRRLLAPLVHDLVTDLACGASRLSGRERGDGHGVERITMGAMKRLAIEASRPDSHRSK